MGTPIILLTASEVTVLDILLHEKAPPEVVALDLRPVGLDIHGDSLGLMIGSNQLKNNTFKNVYVMVGIGKGVLE